MADHACTSQFEDDQGRWHALCSCSLVLSGSTRAEALRNWEGHVHVTEARAAIDKAKGE